MNQAERACVLGGGPRRAGGHLPAAHLAQHGVGETRAHVETIVVAGENARPHVTDLRGAGRASADHVELGTGGYG